MAEKKRLESTAAGRPKPRPPSWFKPEKSGEVPAAESPQAPAEPAPTAPTPPVPGEISALPAPSGETLLGPPPASETEVLDFLEAPVPPTEPEPPAAPVASPPADSSSDWERARLPEPSSSGALPRRTMPEEGSGADSDQDDRLGAEIEQLDSIVSQVECLAYLKPRLARIRQEGCSSRDITGLYRIVSQAMLELMFKQVESVEAMRSEFHKKLREEQEALLFAASSDLVASAMGRKAREAPPPQQPPPPPSAHEQAQTAVLRKQLEIKDELLLEAQERYDKLVRDVQNIRSRQEKDLELQLQRARESLFRKLLPVLDSFDGALEAEDRFSDVQGVIQGLQGIRRQLLDSCESEGLQSIEAVGEPFDPNFHEAMGHVETGEIPEDHVFDQIRRGYLLGEKLLRASMVRLARHPGQEGAAAPGKPEEARVEPAPVLEPAASDPCVQVDCESALAGAAPESPPVISVPDEVSELPGESASPSWRPPEEVQSDPEAASEGATAD